VLYFDGFSGASGDMVLGALVDAGVPLAVLQQALGSLALDGVTLEAERVMRAGVSATKVKVLVHGHRADAAPVDAAAAHSHEHSHTHTHAHQHEPGHAQPQGHTASHSHEHTHAHSHEHAHGHDHGHEHGHSHEHGHRHSHDHDHAHGHAHDHGHDHGDGHGDHGHGQHDHGHEHSHEHRSLPHIVGLIERSALSTSAKATAIAWMTRLAEAESAIHDVPVERIHLHEVGAIDSIADVVCAVAGLEHLGADRVVCAPLNVGGGTVHCAHGDFPVPAPATLRLLQGVPTFSAGPRVELLTPTGALVLTGVASAFGPQPAMRVGAIGYGAGDRDFPGRPNVLRLIVGESDEATGDVITVIECEIDDMTPQVFGDVMDRLFDAGAVDVYFVPVHMKKNRPGTLITVLVQPDRRDAVSEVLFAETTTLGVRYHDVRRECLEREHRVVTTPFGDVRVKLGWRRGHLVNAVPEFDDCRRLSRERGVPVKDVQAAAVRAWLDRAPATS